MKKAIAAFLLIIVVFTPAACGNSQGADPEAETSVTENNTQTESTVAETPSSSASETPDSGADDNETSENHETEDKRVILVVYFSRAGENYGVGYIEKGNTAIIADMIAEETNADTFEIERITPYPADYDECTVEAKQEQNDNARPELTATVENFYDYDVIFLGYPNWWGDMPMPVYTFLESYDFSGKTVIPFCTHAGSGLSNTVETLKDKLSGATVLDGLAIPGTTAQNKQDEAKQSVVDWLSGLTY